MPLRGSKVPIADGRKPERARTACVALDSINHGHSVTEWAALKLPETRGILGLGQRPDYPSL